MISNVEEFYTNKDVIALKSNSVYFQIAKKCIEIPVMLQKAITAYDIICKDENKLYDRNKWNNAINLFHDLNFDIYLWLNNPMLDNITFKDKALENIKLEFNKIIKINKINHTFEVDGLMLKNHYDLLVELLMNLKQDCEQA